MRSAGIRGRMQKLVKRYPTLRHVMVLLTGTAISQVVVMAVSTITARLFTPEAFGQFAVFGSLTAIATTIASMRLDMTIMLPEDDDEARRIARVATYSNLAVAGLFTLAALLLRDLVIAQYGDPELASWLVMGGFTVFFVAQATMMQFWFNRKTDYRTISLNRVQQSIGSAGGQLGFGLLGLRTLPGLIFGTLIGQAFAFVNLRLRAKSLFRPLPEGTTSGMELVRRYKKMPLLNMPTALVDSLRTNGITLLIGTVALGAVGQFNLAWRILQVPIGLINSAISQVFFQKLARVRPGEMLPLVRATILRSLLITLVPFGLIYLVAPWMFTLVFGPQWDMAGEFARALTPWLAMQLVTSPISTVFVVTDNQQWMLGFSIVFCAAPLSLLYFSPLPLLETVFWLGLLMAGMLALMLLMSLLAARGYDRRRQADPAAAAASGPEPSEPEA
ncbi:membrane protein involved in the export of O-antigen and teichoic acid [Brachybacterium faecium DSM 4810]|uniref:Membrane protein involved in the export of O-antigen and teichoic acid n=1 Tax=Brachybacterium faecium (strain ATCC 43885 / DSM 4810 / JCM 11609 / LMG 19847 / NBRC 14762 / NCIMB 9860 / 6-10) TaxID=446465 RepID=C7MEA0_BRAFD|nr:membrane protein involved in the export of O-antigen and teichoic acid [Brachybacterium faecium DSM 4810]